ELLEQLAAATRGLVVHYTVADCPAAPSGTHDLVGLLLASRGAVLLRRFREARADAEIAHGHLARADAPHRLQVERAGGGHVAAHHKRKHRAEEALAVKLVAAGAERGALDGERPVVAEQ